MKRNNNLKSIPWVMAIMLAGKLLSLVANQAYLSYFGAADEHLNIFSWALQIPNYLFQSLGTALSSVVIPVFAALCAKGQRQEANRFGSNIISISTAMTLVLVVIGMGLSLVLPSFTEFSDKSYAAMAVRILMPVMLFYSLTYIYQGILQSLNHFIAPALVNLPSGIVILLYLALFARQFGVTGLLFAVVFGLFLQFVILLPPAHRAGFRFRPVFDLKNESIRTAGRMMVPIILGASAYQFNMFFNNMMMTNIAPESVSLFNFVQTLILSSVMTLVLAITSVIYPSLSSLAATEDMANFRDTLSSTMSGLIYLLTPITVGLICLGRPLFNLISLHGKVVPENITTETHFLIMYCLCVVFLGLKEIVDRAFYSLKTTKISAIAGVIILVLNLVLGYILSKFTPLQANGIPLAYSIAVITGTVYLIVMLRRRIGFFGGQILTTAAKSLLSAGIMGVGVCGLYRCLSLWLTADTIVNRLLLVLVPTIAGAAVFFAVSYLTKTPPILEIAAKFKKRGNP